MLADADSEPVRVFSVDKQINILTGKHFLFVLFACFVLFCFFLFCFVLFCFLAN